MTNERNLRAYEKAYAMFSDKTVTARVEDFYAWNSPDAGNVHAQFYNGKAMFVVDTIHAVNSEVIARIVLGLPEDYMFFRGTLPFVIDGVPQFITVSVCALIVLTILSFLGDIRDSVRFLRRK